MRSYQPTPVPRELIESHHVRMRRRRRRRFAAWFPGPSMSSRVSSASPLYGARAMDYARQHHPPDGTRSGTGSTGPASKSSGMRRRVIVISGPGRRLQPRRPEPDAVGACAGLGTCWVGSPMLWISTPEVRAELKIPLADTGRGVLPRLCRGNARAGRAREAAHHLGLTGRLAFAHRWRRRECRARCPARARRRRQQPPAARHHRPLR